MTSWVLFLLAAEGRVVRGRPRGAWTSSQWCWAPAEAWLEEPLPRLEPEAARVELASRWLAAFGPATVTDLKWWTGWTLTQTRAALGAIEAVEVDLDGRARIRPARRPRARAGARAVGRVPAVPRPDRDGLEGARLVPRRARGRRSSTGTETQARRCGGTAASSAAGRGGRTARSRSACSRTWARRRSGDRGRGRPASGLVGGDESHAALRDAAGEETRGLASRL